MNVDVANIIGVEILNVDNSSLTEGADEVMLDIHEARATGDFGSMNKVNSAIVILPENSRCRHGETKGRGKLAPVCRMKCHIAEADVLGCGGIAGDNATLSVGGIEPGGVGFTH